MLELQAECVALEECKGLEHHIAGTMRTLVSFLSFRSLMRGKTWNHLPVTSHHGRNLKTEIERALGHASFKRKNLYHEKYIWNILKYVKTYSAFDWQRAGLDQGVSDTGHSLICNEDSSWGNRLNCGSKRTLGSRLKWNMSERSIFTLKCWFENLPHDLFAFVRLYLLGLWTKGPWSFWASVGLWRWHKSGTCSLGRRSFAC